jgi:tetratricopeptide (TPR) repeat protein
MSLWRDVADFALDQETLQAEAEQLAWIGREPDNAKPYYNLAQLRRMQYKPDEGLALLLHAIHLDPGYADAHVALTELYAVKGDHKAAWTHARHAASLGLAEGVDLLARHRVPEA